MSTAAGSAWPEKRYSSRRPGRSASFPAGRFALVAAACASVLALPSRCRALTADECADIAPAGSPDGKVDSADVDLALRVAAGDATLDASAIERGDVAPVTPLSPATDHPQLVRPNPNPVGPLDIGDVVVIARRAAGLIAFGEVNQAPTIRVSGDGDIVSVPTFPVSGTISDDTPVATANVVITVGGAAAGTATITTSSPTALTGTFSLPVTLADGGNSIVATPYDSDGKAGAPVTITVTLDQTPPELTIDAPPDGTVTNQGSVQLSGTASDASGVTVTVDGLPAVLLPPNLWGATVDLPQEGPNTFTVTAKDGATPPNVTTLTRVIIHDTTPPEITIDPLPPATNVHTFAMTGTVSDRWGIASVAVGDQVATIDWDSSTASGTWTALVPVVSGDNTYTAVATDNGGNQTSAGPVSTTGDFVPPTVTLLSSAFVNKTPTDLKLGFSEPVYVDQIGSQTFSPATFVDSGGLTLSVPLQVGANELTVRVRDVAGNLTNTEVTVTLDETPPQVTITRVSNAAFEFQPPGGLDGVITNAPSLVVEGTVSDNTGVQSVTVNGFTATVDGSGIFSVSGVPLIPRRNTITATATDLAGNTATDSVNVLRDAEGPVVTLDFNRAAYVSDIDPAPAPFNVPPLPSRYYTSPGDIVVHGTASDPYYTNVASLAVTLDGNPLSVTADATNSTFSFSLPVSVLHTAGLHLIQVTSTDSLGNQTVNVQSFLAGQWVVPNGTIANAIGAAAGPGALTAISSLLSTEVNAMVANGMPLDQSTSVNVGVGTVTVTIKGLGFCEPPGDPTNTPYNCTANATATLALKSDGHIGIAIHIPVLYVGVHTGASGVVGLFCGSSHDGYVTASPADVTLEADFTNVAPDNVALQAVPGTISVSINNLNVHTNNSCVDTLASWFSGTVTSMLESQFANEIPVLLNSVNAYLAQPQLTDDQTGRAVWIARASNDASSMHFWLDAHGNPCPTAQSKTDIKDANGNYLPCPADSPRLAPGSYAGTPDTSASMLPNLNLVAPDGTGVSAQAAPSDNFVNYMVHEQWAMGRFDMTVDQSTLGAHSSLSLDTNSLSLFLPDLARSDVVQKVPLGSKVAIEVYPPLPPILKGRQADAPYYDLYIGDMRWRFMADTNNDGTYDTELFTAFVSIEAPAKLSITPAPNDNSDDLLNVQLGTPTIHSDVANNPLVLNEASVRSAISTLINVALPQLTGSLTSVSLPTNTARFSQLEIEAPQQDYLVLSGAILQTITVTSPTKDQTVSSDPVLITGTVAGLENSAGSSVAMWLPGDTSGRAATITSLPDGNSLSFSGSIPLSAFADGDNVVRIVATDGNGVKAMTKLTLTRSGSSLKASAASGCGGCDGAGDSSLLVLLGLFLVLGLRRRRRLGAAEAPALEGRRGPSHVIGAVGSGMLQAIHRAVRKAARPTNTLHSTALPLIAPLLVATAVGGMSQCSSCGGSKANQAVSFHGPAVAKDPVFILNTIQIGKAGDGFDVDGNTPGDVPGPDNALSTLGPLANPSLTDAMKKGSLLLLIQLPGIDHLPAAGQSGTVDMVAYLGDALDPDPTKYFDGYAKFAKDPASFDAHGNPLIEFKGTQLVGNRDGTTTLNGGPASFQLSIPISGSTLTLKLSPTYIRATLGLSPLRKDGIQATNGLLGGVIPASALAKPIPGLGIAPLALLADQVDVDLNHDGKLDHTDSASNPDGVSAGLVFTGVPAYLSNQHVNIKPVLTLDALPANVSTAHVTVTGTVDDPDGDCTKTKVTMSLNGGASQPAAVAKASKACSVKADIKLAPGANTIVGTATDTAGGTTTAQVTTNYTDSTPPALTLTGPTGHVTDASQNVTGVATDEDGIQAVQITLGGKTTVVAGTALDAQGHFSTPVTLPALGDNVITAVAQDLAGNNSTPATETVTLDDVTPPTVTFTGASCTGAQLSGDGPWTLPEGDVKIDGTLDDDAGIAGITATWNVTGGTLAPVTIDPATGAFELSMTLGLGATTLHLDAADASGNHTTVDRNLTIADTTPPVITVVSPDALVHAVAQVLGLQITDDWSTPDQIAATASIDGAAPVPVPFDSATSTFHLPLTLVLGDNPLIITATDAAGNVATLNGDIQLVDNTPPTLTVTSPDDNSTRLETVAHVKGTATDDIGPVTVKADTGGAPVTATPAADGSFSLDVPLAMGANVVTIAAVDAANNMTQAIRRVTRLDPNAVATIDLTADPTAVAIGNFTTINLTATLTRLAGGPVPDGTQVQITASPTNLGSLDSSLATTTGGVATDQYLPGNAPGLVTLVATAQCLTATASVTIAKPTAVAADVCLAETKTLTGTSFDIGLASSSKAQIEAPPLGGATTLDATTGFYIYNRAALPTTVLVAGTQAITGAWNGSPIARITWPLDSGILATSDFSLTDAKSSDDQGVTSDASQMLFVCNVNHLLGTLPPRVTLAPLPATVTVAGLTVAGTVQSDDLAKCTGEFDLNSVPMPIDVTRGSFSLPITLTPGVNDIRVVVTDSGGRQGSDEKQVIYAPPNDPPTLTITAPGSAVSHATGVTVSGTVSDADDGLTGMTVSVRVDSGTPVDATIAADGTWTATVNLASGTNTITVTATDARGASTIASQTTQVVAPVPPPVVTITAPADGTITTTPSVALTGHVDNGGNPATITVTMTNNGTSEPITFSPFTRNFTATVSLDAGTNIVIVTATDITNDSGAATVRVDYNAPNAPPKITITSPTSGTTYASGPLTVTGTVSDDQPLSQLQSVTVNGTTATVDTTAGTWTATLTLTYGSQTITATATDGGGATDTASVTIPVIDPVVVVNTLKIGSATDGFVLDTLYPTPLSDAGPDNALSGLASVANGPLQDQLDGTSGKPLIILFDMDGLGPIPAPGQSATVNLVGYIGDSTSSDPAVNFSGNQTFTIDPSSLDASGNPLIEFKNVVATNNMGNLQFNTYPSNPAHFELSIDSTSPPLDLKLDPAFIKATISVQADGFHYNPGLLGGVVPAADLAVPITVSGTTITPLQVLLSNDPSHPCPDIDLDRDGTLDDTDATTANKDGVSVGIDFTAVPAHIQR